MSASTVSITANPTTRRRSAVVTEEKNSVSNLELFPVEGAPAVSVLKGDGEGQVRDLSNHSIRGEAGAAKDALQAKKTNSAPRTRRSSASTKPEKPLWLTVLSIFTKNFALIVVVLGLFQLIRTIAVEYGKLRMAGDRVFHPGMMEFEERITDVEKLVKKTTKMVQVQVEVVEKMIESEVGEMKKELNENIAEKITMLEKKFDKIADTNEGVEKSVADLKADRMNLVSRAEFEKIYNNLKKNGELNGATLNDIKVYAREVVENEIAKHAADGLGMADYALGSAGAEILKHSEPYVSSTVGSWLMMVGRGGVHPNAAKMITPSFGEPAKCFPLKGSEGFVEIRLRGPVIPEAVTLEHVAKSVAYDRSSAPRACKVSGWLQNQDSESDSPNTVDLPVGAKKIFPLVDFIYDLDKSNAQTYNVIDQSGVGLIDTIRLDFLSNHGNPSHTCIYRLRVHGRQPDSDFPSSR